MYKYIVIVGSLLLGVEWTFGPFDTSTEADAWAKRELGKDEWIVVGLREPTKLSKG